MTYRGTRTPPSTEPFFYTFLVAAFILGASGCTIIPSPKFAYENRAERIHRKNERRHKRAVEELEEQGFEIINKNRRIARLPDGARDRCYAQMTSGHRIPPDETVELQVRLRDEGTLTTRRLTVGLSKACEFYRGERHRLQVEESEEPIWLVRVPVGARLARNPDGPVVMIGFSYEIVGRHRPLVWMTCNETPVAHDSNLKHQSQPVMLVGSLPAPSKTVSVKRRVIEPRCTTTIE